MSEFALVAQEIVPKGKPRARRKAKPDTASIPPAKASERYAITKHCCRHCFGRVLKVIDVEPAIYRCADCGLSGLDKPASICSCGMMFSTGRYLGVRCTVNPDRSAVFPPIIVASEAP